MARNLRHRISLSLLPMLVPVLLWAQPPQQEEELQAPRAEFVDHSLRVNLDPGGRSIAVTNTMTLPETYFGRVMTFDLNSNLNISDSSIPIQRLSVQSSSTAPALNNAGVDGAGVTTYGVDLTNISPSTNFTINYEGVIYDLAEQNSPQYAQSFSETAGIISEQGVYLAGASAWIPGFNNELIQYLLTVSFAPGYEGWSVITQGERGLTTTVTTTGTEESEVWRVSTPTEEAHLIAYDFTVYSQMAEDIEVLAYLRTPDSNLAARYMDATDRYLEVYEPLLGDYPYSKFALVENFWETGYGMPSFTLLGPQVIRFPFILETSYPHEILHNWWGNSVYPDYESGNWSEGLTAYLADHLFREMDGLGFEYRKEMLARYKNYVSAGRDFPLSEFTSRNSAASQAVGYGKTLMVWHMLRVQLGDELFIDGLRRLYNDYKFQRASWMDIADLFSDVAGTDILPFFQQWVDRTGAPELSLSVEETAGNRARLTFTQIQLDDPFSLRVPVALYYADSPEPEILEVDLNQRLEAFIAEDYDQLQAVLVDPWFDIFRTLDREETPPTVGELFGAEEITFVVSGLNQNDWMEMARSFGEGVSYDILIADGIDELPQDRSVWLLGRDNPFLPRLLDSVGTYGGVIDDNGVGLAGNELEYGDRSTVVIGRHPANPELALGWIHIDDMVALPGMIEKLPHYGKYSYLSFYGDEPTNDVSGVWESPDSPLRWVKPELAGALALAELPPRESIAVLPPKYDSDALLQHAAVLTDPSMQGRSLGSAGLDAAALYIADEFRAAGLRPLGGTYLHRWRDSLAGYGLTDLANVIGYIPGANPALSGRPVIVGAHYDHLGVDESGQVYPGADDNASGIAVMLELAANLARSFTPERPLIFIAFTGEENGLLGSQRFIDNPPGGFAAEDYYAMVNLDAVGRLEGKSLQVFGSDSAYEWPFMAQGIGFTIGVDSEMIAETIAASDHVSFLNAGIPAIHLFSGTHSDYHRVSDSADKLDGPGMSDVALWLEEAVVYLGSNVDPLRVNLENARVEVSATAGSEREASLGTVPDFAYSGDGIRISDVTPGSAAEQAGLQAGDVLLRYDGAAISDLQAYSNLLRQSNPGDVIVLEVRRGAQTSAVQAQLQAR